MEIYNAPNINNSYKKEPKTGNMLSESEVSDLYKVTPTADQDLGKLYNAGVFTQSTPTLGDALGTSNYQAPTPTGANTPYKDIDEDKVKRDVLQSYQSQLDATKGAFSQLFNDTRLQGTGRLGEGTAQQARGGLLGSDFGQAQTDKIRAYNQNQEQNVLLAEAQAISAIMAKANADARQAVLDKRTANQYGYEGRKQWKAEEDERNATNLKKLSQSFLLGNIDPQTNAKLLKDLSKKYGVSEGDIINSYLENKSADMKEKYQTVGSGSALVNPETGEIIYQSEKSNDLTPYQQFTATQSIAKDTQARTENAREMSRQAQLIKQSYNNIVGGGDRSLNTQAIVTSFNKILDPTSVVRESEYDRTAAGQSLIAQLEGKVQQIATGGAGITDATIKEAADIADQYLKESQASVLQQNERARSMAGQFGLNPDFVTTGGYTQTSPDDVSWEDL